MTRYCAGSCAEAAGEPPCGPAPTPSPTRNNLNLGEFVCGDVVTGNTGQGRNVRGNAARELYIDFEASASGRYTFDSCGSGFDTWLRLYTRDLSTEITNCDDCGPCGTRTVLSADLGPGSYTLMVEGYSAHEGEFTISIVCPVAALGGTEFPTSAPTKAPSARPTAPPTPSPTFPPTEAGVVRSSSTCEDLIGASDNWRYRNSQLVCSNSRMSSNGFCLRERNYEQSRGVCTAAGARLCTGAEIAAKVTQFSGCRRRSYAWTDEVCTTGAGNTDGRMLYAEQEHGGNNDPICADKTLTKAWKGPDVFCCADRDPASAGTALAADSLGFNFQFPDTVEEEAEADLVRNLETVTGVFTSLMIDSFGQSGGPASTGIEDSFGAAAHYGLSKITTENGDTYNLNVNPAETALRSGDMVTVQVASEESGVQVAADGSGLVQDVGSVAANPFERHPSFSASENFYNVITVLSMVRDGSALALDAPNLAPSVQDGPRNIVLIRFVCILSTVERLGL